MLTFLSNSSGSYCDRISRRGFLQAGTLAGAGLSLPGLLRAEALAGSRATGKSVINIYLHGGPSHMDMFDLKPDAPAEFRGEYRPIATNAGFEICELLPRLAAVADRFAVIRSVTGFRNEHTFRQSDSGWDSQSLASIGGRPSLGSVLSKVFGPVNGSAPTFADLNKWTNPGFLGQIHSAFRPTGDGRANLVLNRDVPVERLADRQALLAGLDRLRRDADSSGMMDAVDSFTERAMSIITSGEIAEALDLRREAPHILARYGSGGPSGPYGPTANNQTFLAARRLVEAGVRCVSLMWRGWDTHVRAFPALNQKLPALDQALSALIEDLDARGLLDETIILMSGEFGRTPRINKSAGRDHWPQVGFVFLAGGGLRTGQMIGATNRLGEQAQDRPIHLQQVFATVYRQLGIDPDMVTLEDPNGRPQYLVDERDPIAELV